MDIKMTTGRTSSSEASPSLLTAPTTGNVVKLIASETKSTRPTESKALSDFIETETLPNTTFHQVVKVIQKAPTEIKTFYLKKNPSATAVSELEATAAAFYRVLAPHHIPETYAVYDSKDKYIGVASEEIPGFKSTVIDRIKNEDLNTDFIEKKGLTIQLMDQLDDKLRLLEAEQERLQRKLQRLDYSEKELLNTLNSYSHELPIKNYDAKPIGNDISKAFKAHLTLRNNRINALIYNTIKINDYYKSLEEEYKITKSNMDNYRIVKGLAIGFTTSYIFMEDDLHRNNLSKFGKRIDFDMSLWPVAYHLKESKLTYFRKPNDLTFKITTNDIINFPNLKDAKPYYWPTNLPQSTSSTTIQTFMSRFADNAYPEQENVIYQKLKDNKTFNHHKYAIMAKFILTNSEIYRQLAQSHIREDSSLNTKPLIRLLVRQQEIRIAEFEKVLVTIPEFGHFFKANYKDIIKELLSELSNQKINFSAESLAIAGKQSAKTLPAAEQLEKLCIYLTALIDVNLIKDQVSKTATDEKNTTTITPYRIPQPLIIESYNEIRDSIVTAMNNYKNPGVGGFYGFMRNNAPLANKIISLCNTISPASDSRDDQMVAIKLLENALIEASKETAKKGGFFEEINRLIKKLNKASEAAAQPEVSTPTLS
jgi:hypothetical protein